jgi:hypothetical protein
MNPAGWPNKQQLGIHDGSSCKAVARRWAPADATLAQSCCALLLLLLLLLLRLDYC